MAKLKKVVVIFTCLLVSFSSVISYAEEETTISAVAYGFLINYAITDGSGETGWYGLVSQEGSSLNLSADAVPAYSTFYGMVGEKIDYPIYEGLTYHYELTLNAYDGDTVVNIPTYEPYPLYAYVSDYSPSFIQSDIENNYAEIKEPKYPFELSSLYDAAFPSSYVLTGSETSGGIMMKYSFTPDKNVSPSTGYNWVYVPVSGYLSVPTMVTFELSLSKITVEATGEEITRQQLTDIYKELQDLNASDDENADKIVAAIENQQVKEEQAGKEAQDQAGEDADKMLGDLSDSDEVGGLDIVGKIKKFWDMLSSTGTADSITFPSASNPFTGDLFWEEQTVDFSPWLNNVYVGYILKVARLLTSLGLLWWILKLYYSLVNSVLNKDSERSPIQVVLGLNPFK